MTHEEQRIWLIRKLLENRPRVCPCLKCRVCPVSAVHQRMSSLRHAFRLSISSRVMPISRR